MILTSEKPPTRICCGEPHYGPMCPDGLTMCCLCFERFAVPDLYIGADGYVWDYCRVCASRESIKL
jgi:hypothetical protein